MFIFFNTLNNLYAMSITQDEAAPETVLRLSELMRYVIYQGQKEEVPLAAEIKYLQDYLELQQIRLAPSVNLQFTQDLHDEQQMVPPLLFIILLENAFKHGIEPAPEDAFLRIDLQTTATELSFCCTNSVDPDYESTHPTGIGLTNLRRRLALRFPARHTLRSEATADTYTAILTLNFTT
ncbi:MAG: histidine kinase [Bacteroidota bacterium]